MANQILLTNGETSRVMRKRLGITQKKLGKELKISVNKIIDLEKERELEKKHIVAVMEYFKKKGVF